MCKEIWKDIEGYEDYQVSNLGNIRSLNYRQTGKVQVLKLRKDKNGYFRVNLYKDGNRRSYQIHRLVTTAFLPNPDNLPQVNHKDENPSNNRVENLEWCSAKYNANYGTRNQRVAEIERGRIISEEHKMRISEANSIPVAQYTKEGKLIAFFYGTREASRQTGISNTHIADCCRGEAKSAGGFIWKYV